MSTVSEFEDPYAEGFIRDVNLLLYGPPKEPLPKSDFIFVARPGDGQVLAAVGGFDPTRCPECGRALPKEAVESAFIHILKGGQDGCK